MRLEYTQFDLRRDSQHSPISTRVKVKTPIVDSKGRRSSHSLRSTRTVVDLFKSQVQRHPQAIAVHFEDQAPVSYAVINELANAIANRIPNVQGSIIAIQLERSVALVASILGVLKAGATYCILDPYGPLERSRFIVSNVQAPIVITNNDHVDDFDHCLSVDDVFDMKRYRGPERDPRITIDPNSAAYIIYTSGSQGQPKGVVVSHRAATSGIEHFSLNDRARWLLLYNPTFSAAQRTILATLCHGGTICLATRERLLTSLSDVVSNMNIEGIGATSSMLGMLDAENLPPSLKQITLVGEPVTNAQADGFAEKLEVRISYGLSECAQLNFSHRLVKGNNPSIIGHPVDTTKAFILRPGTFEVASSGEVGEICLTGPQLADGYLNRPSDTARVFQRNPFGLGKILRTGDLARRHKDGTFEIVGRLDNQVKINGQRLEPGEITAVLARHDGIKEVLAVDTEVKDSKAIAAAIVRKPEYDWYKLVGDLQELSVKSLPSYMVPSYWVQFSELPLNANGKVDVRQVKSNIQSMSNDELLRGSLNLADGEEIEDPVEKMIQQCWADILSLPIEAISRNDSFFSLGGSSLEAIRMITKLKSTGLTLSLEAVFRRDDIAALRSQATVVDLEGQGLSDTVGFEPSVPFALLPNIDSKSLGPPSHVVNAYPTTELQTALITATLNGRDDYAYQRAWDIRKIDILRLRLAFHVMFLKNPLLRTTFVTTDTDVIQVIRNDLEFPWKMSDLGLEDYKIADLKESFQPGTPFWRAAIVQKNVLVVTMHHALFDFWSHDILYQDVTTLYAGVDPSPRPDFSNFIATLSRRDWSTSETFWRDYLATASVTVLNFSPAVATTTVKKTLSLDLESAAADLGSTAGTLIYLAWGLVLAQHTSSLDVTFATPLSGREAPIPKIERLDGPTSTVVPRRFKFDAKSNLVDFMKEFLSSSFEVIEHSQYGLRRALKAAGQTSRLFDTMVNILPSKQSKDKDSSEIFVAFGDRPDWKTEYSTLEIDFVNNVVNARFTSNIEEMRANFIVDHFFKALSVLLYEPLRPISELTLTTEVEIEMLQNVPEIPQKRPQTLLESFDEMVKRFPTRPAIQWQALETVTYEQLDKRANQFARMLIKAGLRHGDFACVLLEKSPMVIIAILAILKSGAVYVPLSPDTPAERNALIVDEVRAAILISESSVEQAVTLPCEARIDVDEINYAAFSAATLGQKISSEDVAYVIYTSGSTGKPKGILIPHGAVAASIESQIQFEGRRNGLWRCLQFSNLIFDASVMDIFNTLNSGGTLCLAPTERLLSELANVINEMLVTHSFFTPTVARLLSPKDVPNLRSISVGGEAVTEDVVALWSGDCRIVNAYGPTETSIAVTMRTLQSGDKPSNIGKPFPTSPAFILERNGPNLVPYGAIGELCIAGPQIGLGYINRPEATQVAFVETELSGFNKLYRTGDLGRWLPNGEIEILGRKDHQVKVNGHRIELGEIERQILATNTVSDCVTIVADIDSKPQLASFIVFTPGSAEGIQQPYEFNQAVADLRSRLSGLPHYMYPKLVFPLEAMPKMPSGKADRKILKTWAESMEASDLSKYNFDFFGSSRAIVPVETKSQKLLEKAFSKVLGIAASNIGQEANFLALGGDSISAINLNSFARNMGYDLSVNSILSNPTLKDLALHLKSAKSAVDLTQVMARYTAPPSVDRAIEHAGLVKSDIDYIYPCPPGQSEFLTQGAMMTQNWALMTCRPLPSHHNVESWAEVTSQLSASHDILRSTFTRQDNAWYGVVLADAKITIPVIDISDEAEKQYHLDRIWSTPFYFGEKYISYTALHNTVDNTISLVTKLDHGLYDGTLLRIFAKHFLSLQQDPSAPLPEHTPFQDFAFYHSTIVEEKNEALSYFTANVPSTSFQYPAGITDPIATSSIFVPGVLPGIEYLASTAGVTVPILFQAAYQCFMSIETGQQRVSMDYLYTGRNVDLPNPQEITGATANFLPLETVVDPDLSLRDFLQQSQKGFWSMTDHGVVGLEDIFGKMKLDRKTHGNKSLFLYQPFESSPASGNEDAMQWIVIRGSEVRMLQPYALVVEVSKLSEGYKVKVTFDDRFGKARALDVGEGIWDVLQRMVEIGQKGRIKSCLL